MKKLDAAKASQVDQIFVNFFKDGALVTSIYLASVINLSIKLDVLFLKCRLAKLKPLLKKGIKIDAKN